MKIEKLGENKIRVTFHFSDLEKNHIDVHSFMSNSIESQSLFLNILDEAEREVGFITDDYKLSVEALALSNGYFVLTVTRFEKEILKSSRVHARKKDICTENNILIAKFSNLDDLFNFENFLTVSSPKLIEFLTNTTLIYQYNGYYFLILQDLSPENLSFISPFISEFGVLIDHPDLIFHKIKEYGVLITENSIHKT